MAGVFLCLRFLRQPRRATWDAGLPMRMVIVLMLVRVGQKWLVASAGFRRQGYG